jgi:hypothetical protein
MNLANEVNEIESENMWKELDSLRKKQSAIRNRQRISVTKKMTINSEDLFDNSQSNKEIAEQQTRAFKLQQKLKKTLIPPTLESKNIIELLQEYFSLKSDQSLLILQYINQRLILILVKNEKQIIRIIYSPDLQQLSNNIFNLIDIFSDEEKLEQLGEKKKKEYKKQFRVLGKQIAKHFPKEILDEIYNSQSLLFSGGDRCIDFQIDYLYHNDCFLGQQLPTSRVFSLKHFLQEALSEQSDIDDENKKAVIIGNPKTDKYPSLELAEKEGNWIGKELAQLKIDTNYLIHEKTMLTDIVNDLTSDLSLFHFSGHGENDGLVLSYDDKLDFDFVTSQFLLFKNRPIVFLNCCKAGTVHYSGGGMFEGLIPNLMRAKVGPIIASNKVLFDDNALLFSKTFYQQLFAGKTVGEAFFAARKSIADTLLWGKYQLFGNIDQQFITKED